MERGVLDIQFSRFKETTLKDEHLKLFGFVLMAKGKSFHFYVRSREEQVRWKAALKNSCIFTDLRQDFKLDKEVIGRGNFAKVNKAARIDSDDFKYVVKSINRFDIKKFKRTI